MCANGDLKSSKTNFYYGASLLKYIIKMVRSLNREDVELAEALTKNAKGEWQKKQVELESRLS